MRRNLRPALAAVLFSLCAVVQAAVLSGEVVGLADGDTITVLDSSHTQHKIRLAGIDAPEKRQAFGNRSKESLSSMVFRQRVEVHWKKTDRYGRIIGKVVVKGVDVCLQQVKRGMAWHYKAYAREQSVEDRTAYAEAEEEARRGRVGLWRDQAPIAPWDFRRSTHG